MKPTNGNDGVPPLFDELLARLQEKIEDDEMGYMFGCAVGAWLKVADSMHAIAVALTRIAECNEIATEAQYPGAYMEGGDDA